MRTDGKNTATHAVEYVQTARLFAMALGLDPNKHAPEDVFVKLSTAFEKLLAVCTEAEALVGVIEASGFADETTAEAQTADLRSALAEAKAAVGAGLSDPVDQALTEIHGLKPVKG